MNEEPKKITLEAVENDHKLALARLEMGGIMLKIMNETEWKNKLKEPIMQEIADDENLFNLTTILSEIKDKNAAIVKTIVANMSFADALVLQEEINYLIKRQMAMSVSGLEDKADNKDE